MAVSRATYNIVYQSKDITRALAGELISITYRDKTHGEADELVLRVKDDSHKWKNAWRPQKGDTLEGSITSGVIENSPDPAAGAGVLNFGKFTVIGASFSGDAQQGHICNIRGLSAGNMDPVRTKTSFAHEGKSLKEIAEYYANKHHLKLTGIVHDYAISRVTQFHETDLAFLHRIALEFGYHFSIRGDMLVFTYLKEHTESMKAGVDVNFKEVVSYDIRDEIAGIYVRGQNRWHNPKTKTTYDSLVDMGANPLVNTGQDTHKTHHVVDDDQEGLYKADGRLYVKNMDQVEIDATVPGNVALVTGSNVNVKDWGDYDGVYFISYSVHTVNAEGNYVTRVELKRLVENKDVGNKKGNKQGYNDTATNAGDPAFFIQQIIYILEGFNSAAETHPPADIYDFYKSLIDKEVASLDKTRYKGPYGDAYINTQLQNLEGLVNIGSAASARNAASLFANRLGNLILAGEYQ